MPAFFPAPQPPAPPPIPPQNLALILFDCGKLFVPHPAGRSFAPLAHADLRLSGRPDLIDAVFEVSSDLKCHHILLELLFLS
jgi:hypothetical protein